METGHTVEWSSEENYMFKLSEFQEKLLHWINSTPYRELLVTNFKTDVASSTTSFSRVS